jgi:hypothetical protein
VIQRAAPTRKIKSVDGNDLLYHFLQKVLLEEDAEQFEALATRLVVALGVWFPPEIYRRHPILLPYAVRDPKCRGDKRCGLPDEWGSPSADGRFRDDNSLVKGLPRSLSVSNAGNRLLHGKRLGTGFVASHVWRKLTDGRDAARNWKTYTFVPNLVWLPSQLSKLSDREGSFVQTFLQALARRIYSSRPETPALKRIADQAWALLPERPEAARLRLPDARDLNYFAIDEAWIRRRIQTVEAVERAVGEAAAGKPLRGKVISSRYGAGLGHLRREVALTLRADLGNYLGALGNDVRPVRPSAQ